MKKIFKILLIINILITAVYAEDKHDHDNHNHSEEGFYSHLDVVIFADTMRKVDKDGKYNEIYSHSHMELGKNFDGGWSINSNIKLEGGPDGDSHVHGGYIAPAGEDHGINDHMLVLEELKLDYDSKKFSAYLGKFNPVVGFNYHNFPGMYGYQAVEEYGIKEKIGFGGSIKHYAGSLGTHDLNLSTFYADTGPLSDSLFFSRGHNSKEDSGVANTEDFSSYSVSLGGSLPYSFQNNSFVKEISYRLGFAEQAAGINDATDNTRYSASIMHEHEISDDLGSKIIFERMQIDNKAAEAAHDRSYTTGGLELNYQKWNIGSSYTYIDNDADEADESFNGNIFQGSIGYDLSSNVNLNFGFKNQDTDNKKTERIGTALKISY